MTSLGCCTRWPAHAQHRGSDAPPLLLRAAKTLEPLDPKLARETYLDAWSAALFAGQLATDGDLYDVSREARRVPAATEPARASDLLLDGFATLLTAERSEATPLLQRAVRCFAGDDAPSDEVLRWGWVATVAAVAVWDYERCVAIASRGVQLARDAGALTVLAVALHINAQSGDRWPATLVGQAVDLRGGHGRRGDGHRDRRRMEPSTLAPLKAASPPSQT